jgi:glycolate oxidase FAD binding subunit
VRGFGTLAILLEVSIKVRPRASSEITLIGAMGVDQAIPLMNRLPLSGAVCDGQVLWVRLSGERRALAEARAATGALDQAPEPGFWEAVREQRLPFFRDDRPLWRISLPPATPALALPGDWLIDWGGAQRWLKTDAGAEEVRGSAAEQRGYAVLFRGGDRRGEVFPPLPDGLGALHARLKGVFDPRRIKDYGRLLRHDPRYADRAERVSRLTRDISEVVVAGGPTGNWRLPPAASSFIRCAA